MPTHLPTACAGIKRRIIAAHAGLAADGTVCDQSFQRCSTTGDEGNSLVSVKWQACHSPAFCGFEQQSNGQVAMAV